jgi:hypothetical protein
LADYSASGAAKIFLKKAIDRKLDEDSKSFFKIVLSLVLVEISALKAKKSRKYPAFDTWIRSQIELQIHNGIWGAKDFYAASTGPLGDDADQISLKSMNRCPIGRGLKSIFTIFWRVCTQFSSFSPRAVSINKISNKDSDSALNSASNERIQNSVS